MMKLVGSSLGDFSLLPINIFILQNIYTVYNTLWIPALVLQKCSKILLLVKTEEKQLSVL